MERLGVFLLISIAVMPGAYAALVDTDYVSEFYYDQCNNENLSVPGAGRHNLVGRRWLLNIVDEINSGATTYGVDSDGDNIVSMGFVRDTIPLLAESNTCCLGGAVGGDGQCRACGTWLVESTLSCMAAGQYLNGTKCDACPDGYICPAGTNGRAICGAGYWCKNNARIKCEHGRNQCPGQNHTSGTGPIACDGALTFTL